MKAAVLEHIFEPTLSDHKMPTQHPQNPAKPTTWEARRLLQQAAEKCRKRFAFEKRSREKEYYRFYRYRFLLCALAKPTKWAACLLAALKKVEQQYQSVT